MRIAVARVHDLKAVRAAYGAARATQRGQGSVQWPPFSDESIVAQAKLGQLQRVIDGHTLVGVFTVAYEDSAIWGERERGAHVYLHRIARAAGHLGRGLIVPVLDWGRAHCRDLKREGLRMYAWASNERLIDFYERHGFRVVERRRLGNDPRLAPHYHGNEFALLERSAG